MDSKLGLERLFRWARPRSASEVIDAADVGTAYGMELSIDASQQAADDAKATAARAAAEAPQDGKPR
jgi:hypothetical protein